MKESSGTLLYRRNNGTIEVLIVRPSGPSARFGWSIPKGIPDKDESIENAARRETREETGCEAQDLKYLGHIDYKKSKKRVHCFAGPSSNQEPRLTSWEVDAAKFVPLDEARRLLHEDQRPFIDLLVKELDVKS
jgi:predicted NUDIX family NTP pyrophosphohydrolase